MWLLHHRYKWWYVRVSLLFLPHHPLWPRLGAHFFSPQSQLRRSVGCYHSLFKESGFSLLLHLLRLQISAAFVSAIWTTVACLIRVATFACLPTLDVRQIIDTQHALCRHVHARCVTLLKWTSNLLEKPETCWRPSAPLSLDLSPVGSLSMALL